MDELSGTPRNAQLMDGTPRNQDGCSVKTEAEPLCVISECVKWASKSSKKTFSIIKIVFVTWRKVESSIEHDFTFLLINFVFCQRNRLCTFKQHQPQTRMPLEGIMGSIFQPGSVQLGLTGFKLLICLYMEWLELYTLPNQCKSVYLKLVQF